MRLLSRKSKTLVSKRFFRCCFAACNSSSSSNPIERLIAERKVKHCRSVSGCCWYCCCCCLGCFDRDELVYPGTEWRQKGAERQVEYVCECLALLCQMPPRVHLVTMRLRPLCHLCAISPVCQPFSHRRLLAFFSFFSAYKLFRQLERNVCV